MRKTQKILVVASKETDKTKCMVMYQDQSAEGCHSIKIDNSSSERVEQFKYLGTTLMNPNCIQEDFKSRLNLGNASYHSEQNFFFFQFAIQNIKGLRYTEL
jgi:hypothetical protein